MSDRNAAFEREWSKIANEPTINYWNVKTVWNAGWQAATEMERGRCAKILRSHISHRQAKHREELGYIDGLLDQLQSVSLSMDYMADAIEGKISFPCVVCGQSPEGQTGEYPCILCGLLTVHDA